MRSRPMQERVWKGAEENGLEKNIRVREPIERSQEYQIGERSGQSWPQKRLTETSGGSIGEHYTSVTQHRGGEGWVQNIP